MAYRPSLNDISETPYMPSLEDIHEISKPSKSIFNDKERDKRMEGMFTPLMNTPSSALAQAGYETSKNPIAKAALETEFSSFIPFYRMSRLIPNAGRIVKYGADYLGSIGQSAGLGAGLNVINNENVAKGAVEGGAAAGVIHPIASMVGSSNPYIRIGSLAGLGALGGYAAGVYTGHPLISEATGGLLGMAAGMRGRGASSLAAENLLGNINKDDAITNKNAADRLGLSFLTPGEATGNPIALQTEKGAGQNNKAAQELFEKKLARQGEVKQSIDNLLDQISPKDAYETLEKPAYEKAHQDMVDAKELAPLLTDPRIRNSFNKVASDRDFAKDLKEVEPNSIKYLDYVKKHLDDEIEKAMKKGENNRVRLIKDSKDKLVTLMDEASPSYKEARSIAQKRILRDELQNSMNENEVSGKSFYDKNLANDYGFNKLQKSLKDNPDAQQKLKDMRAVFKNILEPLNARAVSSLAESGAKEKDFTKSGIVKQLNKVLLGGKYDQALVKLMTSNEWDKEFQNVAAMKNPSEKARKMADLLSRIGTVGLTNAI